MTKNTKIGEFLKESRIPGSTGSTAKKITVKLYGKGIFAKQENRPGSENTSYYKRKAGQFIYSKLDFLNGAFGIIPEELDGYESTVDLPCFDFVSPEVSPEWFLQFVSRSDFYSYQGGLGNGGRKARRISPDDFLDLEIEIPPLPEQKKIAEILSGIDKAISIKRQAIKDLTATREAICSELMQNGDWSQEETGDLASHMTNGFVGTATPHYRERGVRYLTSKNIRRDRIDPSKMIYISEEFHMANRKSSLMVGDVLMVQSGHIGTTAVVTSDYKDCNCHALILMRFNQERLDPEYASLYFNSATGKTRLSDIFVGSTVKHVNTGDLRKFKIPVPPLGVQRDIAKRISAIDLLLGKRELQIEKLLILKQAISSDLLSGRKRVSV